MAASMERFVTAVRKNKFLRFGLPMLVLVVGGSFGLKEFRTLRYDIIDKRKTVDPETEERMNARRKKEKVTVEGEFKKMEEGDLDTWHNIRGPRPWEDSKEYQEMARENIRKQQEKKVEISN
ncbi:cytochrome c oxidase assembly protein COX16 homolog, mitochondrial-like [Asterias rubens]|uniref:cytochrome c oxidase assembly protein COX16 homolog, mitochondrial-like n=1 Tax=Asterias rubens TaxID=7604 RepID=UPI001455D83B|nr:cytochrome c oxidase assembly protein COX16 homolog, mitochondrial-like [Asterias rubens]